MLNAAVVYEKGFFSNTFPYWYPIVIFLFSIAGKSTSIESTLTIRDQKTLECYVLKSKTILIQFSISTNQKLEFYVLKSKINLIDFSMIDNYVNQNYKCYQFKMFHKVHTFGTMYCFFKLLVDLIVINILKILTFDVTPSKAMFFQVTFRSQDALNSGKSPN